MEMELEKMQKVKDKSQIIGGFLDWLMNEKAVKLAVWKHDDGIDRLIPFHKSIEQWLAEYFNIDLIKLEQEKQKLLDDLNKI